MKTVCILGQGAGVTFVARKGKNMGRDISVGIATHYGLVGPGIESRWGARISAPVQTGPGAHPASYTIGTGSFPGVKRPGRGVHNPHHLAPRLKKNRTRALLSLGPSWPALGRILPLK